MRTAISCTPPLLSERRNRQKMDFSLWGFIPDKSSMGDCGVFLCVFLHFRKQPNISICLLTESGPCNIVVTGLSEAVCFQLKGI